MFIRDRGQEETDIFRVSENYLKLSGSYLSPAIAKEVATYEKANLGRQVIRLGIGDVTLPIVPTTVEVTHETTDETRYIETFHGYVPDLSYAFLRETIVEKGYKSWGYHVEANEIFISDGARSDYGNIQEIFNEDSRITVRNLVYSTYVDPNVMVDRIGSYDPIMGV